jgi:hypothetical protein
MLIVGAAVAAPEKTRAVTNWRRSKGMGVPRETLRRGLWHIDERQSRVAADSGSDILLFDSADKDSLFDRNRHNTNVFAFQNGGWLRIRSSCISGNSE